LDAFQIALRAVQAARQTQRRSTAKVLSWKHDRVSSNYRIRRSWRCTPSAHFCASAAL
jgi:hypothetical protein